MTYFSISLASCTGDRNNNFNLLRIGAAIAVVLSHSILLSGNLDSSFAWRLGYMAVNCFFVISGFLVCGSLLVRRNLASYTVARLLRIYPALVAVVTVTIFALGPVLSSLHAYAYLTHPSTWNYLLRNSLLVIGEVEFYLPGMFQDNPLPGQVNTPLWTLQYELAMYAALAGIWFICSRINRSPQQSHDHRIFQIAVIVITVVCTTGYLANIIKLQPGTNAVADFLRFGAMFSAGASYYLLRHRIRLSLPIMGLLLLLIFFCSTIRPLYIVVTYLSLPYILLCLAYLPGGLLRRYNYLGDYSYGVYIMAYPIQQTLVFFNPAISSWLLFILTMLVCLPLAAASWHVIEKPALRLKRL